MYDAKLERCQCENSGSLCCSASFNRASARANSLFSMRACATITSSASFCLAGSDAAAADAEDEDVEAEEEIESGAAAASEVVALLSAAAEADTTPAKRLDGNSIEYCLA